MRPVSSTRPSRHRTMHLAALLLVAVLPAAPALADDLAKITAEQLFQEGKALARQGEYTEACARFAASQRLEPAIGTQLNLADCLEHIGKLASAWAHYREVIPLAERQRQGARVAIARARAAALEPRVPRLIVRIDGDELERRDAAGQPVEVTRDGMILERILWGTPLYVDPGRHEVTATGSCLHPFLEVVTVAEGETAEVDVPLRAKDCATTPALAPRPRRESRPSTADVAPWWRRRPAATITGAVGVIAVGTSLAFGLAADDQWDRAYDDRDCVGRYCSARGMARTDRARAFATVSTVAAATGVAALAASAILTFLPRRERLVVFTVDRGAGLSWAGELP